METLEFCKKYKKSDCPYYESNCKGQPTDKLNCVCPKFLAYLGAKDETTVANKLKEMNIIPGHLMSTMLQMQKIFASRFHKIENLNKEEIDHWTNAYLICIEDEIVEAMEFLDIYPERIKEFDINEFRKELIDILHFLMDGILVANMNYTDLVLGYEKSIDYDLHEVDILKFACDNESNSILSIDENNRLLYILNYILRDIRLIRQCISWKHWKKPNDSIDFDKLRLAYAGMFRHLVQAFIVCETAAEEIYNIYVSKNIENVLRQEYGYLTGVK